MKFKLNLLLLLVLTSFACSEAVTEKKDFNEGWYFNLDDNKDFSTENFNHSSWRKLDLPHDWSIEGEYDEANPMGGTAGYLPAGIGFYRKTIEVPAEWKGKSVSIAFDGVFMNSTVWANGIKLGTRPYGWISFAYDISEMAKTAKTITFAVRVDNDKQPSARWYTGSGIYANTWIEVCNPIHIKRNGGIYITTDANKVNVATELTNTSADNISVTLKNRVLNAQGKEVKQDKKKVALKNLGKASADQEFTLDNPILWSVETPYLYTLVSEVWKGKKLLDVVETRFGVRDIEWKPATGMWLNGKNVKLQGVCNHQDAGPLGAAIPDKILRYRIQQLKDMGVNAFRTSHNPQTPQFYDMCDEMGMLVMDEIFDGWKKKATNDYGAHSFNEWWARDLTDWIKRDRNHASIVIYSVGNETKGAVGEHIVAKCHELDPTRPVTSGHSSDEFMDVLGLNGASEKIGYIDGKAKDRCIIGTENTHTWQVRGYYRSKTWYRDGTSNKSIHLCPDLTKDEIFHNDFMLAKDRTVAKKVFNSSYDNAFVRLNSRGHIEQIRDIPNYAGGFRWTGHDYIGEASYVHGGFPFKAFMGGAIDLSNFPKDLFYLYQSQWTEEPMLHAFPHWTHPMMQLGTEVPICVYSNCDEVELFFNGQSLGKKKPGISRHNMQCEWLVAWQPGTLKAVAYKDGEQKLVQEIKTADRPAQNALSIDGTPLSEEGKDIVQVRVETQDSEGTFYPYGENRTYFNVIGPAIIRALGNGSPIDVEKHYGVNNRIAFYGLTRAFIESTGEKGSINLLAAAILGEKKQITSKLVSIDTKMLNLRGASISPEIKVYYTIDGSKPSTESTLYTESFEVDLGTTVKAVVMQDEEQVLLLSERFAEDEGFVWNAPDAGIEPIDPNSEQAENATFNGVTISTEGAGFKGTGYLNFGNNSRGYVEWYRENDGDAMTETLNIRYSCQTGGKGRAVNVIVNGKPIAKNLLLPNTGSWGKHWGSVSLKIQLQRGANTIRIANVKMGGPYIDQISFGDYSNGK